MNDYKASGPQTPFRIPMSKWSALPLSWFETCWDAPTLDPFTVSPLFLVPTTSISTQLQLQLGGVRN